jgi:hypothetical protein
MNKDKHHVLHHKREWLIRPEARAIREHPSLIPLIPRELHTEIHANCPPVPPLGFQTLIRVARDWYPQRTASASIDDLALTIERAASGRSVHDIERRMAELTIEAMMLQRPYLDGDIIVPNAQTVIDINSGRAA